VELPEMRIEISALSAIAPIAPEEIVTGRHGLIVSRGGRSGVLLPQVASEFGWDTARFLEETCRKAGLEPNAWKDPAAKISAFTAEIFGESNGGPMRPVPRYSNST